MDLTNIDAALIERLLEAVKNLDEPRIALKRVSTEFRTTVRVFGIKATEFNKKVDSLEISNG